MSSRKSKERIRVAVVGGSLCTPEILGIAEELGAELARRGCIVITGGLGGVMEASSRGAKKEGGLTIGILPGYHAGDANDYVDIPIVTGMSHARNAILVRSADAIIAVDGQYGTLSEIALGLNMGIPVVGLKTWDIEGAFSAGTVIEAVDRALEMIGGS